MSDEEERKAFQGVSSMELVQQPGDIVYVPFRFGHAIHNEGDLTVAVAIEFMFGKEKDEARLKADPIGVNLGIANTDSESTYDGEFECEICGKFKGSYEVVEIHETQCAGFDRSCDVECGS